MAKKKASKPKAKPVAKKGIMKVEKALGMEMKKKAK